MKCIKCGSPMLENVPCEVDADHGGMSATITVIALQCCGCARIVLDARAREMWDAALALLPPQQDQKESE